MARRQSVADFLQILLYGRQGEEMAPKRSARSLNFMRHSTAEVWRQRWVSMEVKSRWRDILWLCWISGSSLSLSLAPPTAPQVAPAASVLGDDQLSPVYTGRVVRTPSRYDFYQNLNL